MAVLQLLGIVAAAIELAVAVRRRAGGAGVGCAAVMLFMMVGSAVPSAGGPLPWGALAMTAALAAAAGSRVRRVPAASAGTAPVALAVAGALAMLSVGAHHRMGGVAASHPEPVLVLAVPALGWSLHRAVAACRSGGRTAHRVGGVSGATCVGSMALMCLG